MSYRLTIRGRLPGLNEYTAAQRTNRYKGAQMKREAQALAEWNIRAQLKGVKISEPVIISYHYYEPNVKRDVDNIHAFAAKVINDALVSQQVITDDSQRYIKGFRVAFDTDKTNPRIEVDIEEIKNG